MNRLCWTVLSNLRYLSVNSSKYTLNLQSQLRVKLTNVKCYSSTSATGDNPNSSDHTEDLDDSNSNNSVTKNEYESPSTSPSPSPSPKQVKENITDRLKRLSSQSPEEFIPSEDFETAEANRWNRYANVFKNLNARSSNPNPNQRPNSGSFNSGNFRQNFGGGNSGGGGYSGSYNHNRYDNNEERYNPPSRQNRSIRNDDMEDDDDMNFRPPPKRYESRNPPGRRPSNFDDDENNEDFDEDDNSSSRYQGNNTRRYNGRFEDGYNNSFGSGQRQQPQRNSYRDRDRSNNRDFDTDFDDMALPKKINYQKLQKDYDLDDSDLPEEPRQSTSIRFANTENRDAIKEAYFKRFPSTSGVDSGGSKREFHSYAPRVSPQSNQLDKSILVNQNLEDKISPIKSYSNYKKVQSKTLLKKKIIQEEESEKSFKRDILFETKFDNPDVFGTLTSTLDNPTQFEAEVEESSGPGHKAIMKDSYSQSMNMNTIYEEDEEDDQVFRSEVRMNMRQLTLDTKELFAGGKITEGLDLFRTSLKEGGFTYCLHELEYLYRVVVCEMSKVGHIKMAFKLYTEMTKRGLNIKPGLYTSLFNACAQSPWSAESNLKRMNNLRAHMDRKGILPNLVNYNAMIKAYGRCGDIETAFALVDEMLSKRQRELRPDVDTFCFLLQACLSDKANGFRHALFTWDKMKSMGIRPKIYNYNLLLRTARECTVALPPNIQKQIDSRQAKVNTMKMSVWDKEGLQQFSPENTAMIDSNYFISASVKQLDAKYVRALQSLDSVLPPVPLNSNGLEDASKLKLSDNELDALHRLGDRDFRLKMLGGLRGVLQQMRRDRIEPDLNTMHELLILGTHDELLDVLQIAESFSLKPKVNFYNIIIRKLNILGKYHESRDILKLMNKKHLSPDIYTWTALAMGCFTWDHAQALMNDMREAHFTPTIDLLGSLMSVACKRCDPWYVLNILNDMERLGIVPSAEFLDHILHLRKNVNMGLVQAEKGELVTVPHLRVHLKSNPEEFKKNWRKFQLRFKAWVRKVGLDIEPADPWAKDHSLRLSKKKARDEKEEDN